MTFNPTQHPRATNDEEGLDTETVNILSEEVSTLQALYGDENVTMSKRNDGSGAHMISVNLRPHIDMEHVSEEVIALSISVPANYPDLPPQSTTLSVSRMVASHATRLVHEMLERVNVSVGAQCLFDYCQTMLDILHSDVWENSTQTFSSVPIEAPTDGTGNTPKESSIHMDIFHCEPFTERKSLFQAHVCPASSEDDVSSFMAEVRSTRKGTIATHIMSTYRFRDGDGRIIQGYDDDGEKGGGRCMHNVLMPTDAMNIAISLSRWYGGVKLGPARFRIIARLTREAIDAYREHLKTRINT